ncbi:MAG: hypothetical protein ACOYBQ_06335 [Fluviibacter sp.]
MRLNELKNIDIGQWLRSLSSNRPTLVSGPYAKVILWSVLGNLVFFSYVYFVFWPGLEDRQQMQIKVNAIPEMEARLQAIDSATDKARNELLMAERNYSDLNQLFSVESELEELYQRLSEMATSQGLVISSLSKEGEDAIYGTTKAGSSAAQPSPAGAANAVAGKPDPAKVGPPLFYRIRLKMEMKGTYTRYMRYLALLADFDKSINIDKEQITLVPGDNRGTVVVVAQLSTFRLPNKLSPTMAPERRVEPVPAANMQQTAWPQDDGYRFIKMSAPANDPLLAPVPSVPAGPVVSNEGRVQREEQASSTAPTANVGAGSAKPARGAERDPFSRGSSGMIEGGRDPRHSPLLMAPAESYVITGVIVSPGVKAAMIRTDFRENYVVKIGDRLGNQGGVIADIDMDGIVLKQGNGRLRLYLQSQYGQQSAAPGR